VLDNSRFKGERMKRPFSGFLIIIFLASTVMCALTARTVSATGTIHVRADGSVDPSTAPISTLDNVTYTLTGNITANNDGIVIERDNIVVDGAGYVITGSGTGNGTLLVDRSNVTVRDMTINNFQCGILLYFSNNSILSGNNVTNNDYGIDLDSSSGNDISADNVTSNIGCGIGLYSSSDNSLFDNNVTNNGDGIEFSSSADNNTLSGNNVNANSMNGIYLASSSNNAFFGNNVTTNTMWGVYLSYSSSNTLSSNNVAHNYYGIVLGYSNRNVFYGNNLTANSWSGIYLAFSFSNTLCCNNVANNHDGIWLSYSSSDNLLFGNIITTNGVQGIVLNSSGNSIFHNNFVGNSGQVQSINSNNTWDDGYPSGGNYWSENAGVDVKNGPNQNLPGSDGMGDTPYIIDANNTDRYPLMNPWTPPEYDIAISNALPLKTVVGLGYNMNISVTAINQGGHGEEFNVTVYANATIIASENVTLSVGNSATVAFTWNTTGFAYGNYTLSTYAWPVPSETDTTNNNFTCAIPVHVGTPGDVSGSFAGNRDGVVEMRDIAWLIVHFMGKPGDLKWFPNCDINNDGVINMRDIAIAIMNYGKHDLTGF
jgi:parallel beta-helix repeat protein